MLFNLPALLPWGPREAGGVEHSLENSCSWVCFVWMNGASRQHNSLYEARYRRNVEYLATHQACRVRLNTSTSYMTTAFKLRASCGHSRLPSLMPVM